MNGFHFCLTVFIFSTTRKMGSNNMYLNMIFACGAPISSQWAIGCHFVVDACLSEGANDVEFVVVKVLPEGWVAEVGVIHELPATLGPSDWLRLGVSVDDCRVYTNKHVRDLYKIYACSILTKREIVHEAPDERAIEAETPSPPNFHFDFRLKTY